MADNFSLCLIGVMDSLWFHQTVLSPEPFSSFSLQTLKPQQLDSDSTATTTSPSSSRSASSLAENNKIISRSICSLPDHQPLTPEDDARSEEEGKMKKRVIRGNASSSRNRSHSSSPSTQKHHRNHRPYLTSCSVLGGTLQKSTSCRRLKELELEEVEGFMDLGFRFKKEHIDSRMIDIVPGLLRLNLDDDDDDDIEQEEETCVRRPYLSEAWLIKRPDSPLLNLKVPKVSAAADMKKHLKCWAQTVAYVVHQEC